MEGLGAIAFNKLNPCGNDWQLLLELDTWSISGKQPWDHEGAKALACSKDRIEVERPSFDAQRDSADPPTFHRVIDAATVLSLADLRTCQRCMSE